MERAEPLREFIISLVFLGTCGMLLGQSPQASGQPHFEVVSIRSAGFEGGRGGGRGDTVELRGCKGGPGTPDPVRWTCNTNMGDLLFKAYPIEGYQFTPPQWALQAQFEIDAKIPQGATKEQMPLMIRGMLQERFKLAAHFVKKDAQVYEMTVGKGGPRFKEWVDLQAVGGGREAAVAAQGG